MKAFLLTATVLLSLNGFAQTQTELTHEQKLEAFKAIGNFLPAGGHKGSIIGKSKINPFSVHRCVGGVSNSMPEQLSSALYENKAVNLSGFSDDYHPNPVGITYMYVTDKVTQATWSETKASITAQDKDGSTETLEIEKIKDNHAIVTVTYVRPDGSVIKNACDLDMDKKTKD